MKNILVTGASGGMGKAICTLLCDKGYNVFGIDYREGETDERTDFMCCDVTDSDSVEKVKDYIEAKVGSLDGIVHTAGIYDMDSLIEMTEERFVRIFDINLFGVYRINKAFAPKMKKGSRIVITSSELAPLDPLPFNGIYGITKSALEKYAFSLRMELNLRGVAVSIIRPGAVKTGLLGASNVAIDRFRENTKLYNTNAEKFRKIVDSVQSRNVAPEKIADLALKALTQKHPQYIYNINRNPLLKILNALPDHAQVDILKIVLR